MKQTTRRDLPLARPKVFRRAAKCIVALVLMLHLNYGITGIQVLLEARLQPRDSNLLGDLIEQGFFEGVSTPEKIRDSVILVSTNPRPSGFVSDHFLASDHYRTLPDDLLSRVERKYGRCRKPLLQSNFFRTPLLCLTVEKWLSDDAVTISYGQYGRGSFALDWPSYVVVHEHPIRSITLVRKGGKWDSAPPSRDLTDGEG